MHSARSADSHRQMRSIRVEGHPNTTAHSATRTLCTQRSTTARAAPHTIVALLITILYLLFVDTSKPSLLLQFGTAVFHPASAQAYCASGAAFGTLVVSPTTVSTRFGDGCTLSSSEKLTLSGVSIPTGTAAAGAVEMRFSGGTVASQGHIAVQGPTTAAAPAMVPMRVLITRSQFGDGAAVLVTGSYPPGSNITISFNTFASQTRCALLNVISSAFVTVIAYAEKIPMVLGAGAEINTQYNSINTNSGTNVHSIPFVVSSITFNTGASACIKGNYIKTHGNNIPTAGNTWTILFDTGPSYVVGNTERSTFRYLDGGAWRFDDNTVHVSNDNQHLSYVGNSPYLTPAVGGTYSISRNYVVTRPSTVTTQGDNSLFGFSTANSAANFEYRFDGNIIEGYGRNSVMTTLGLVLSGRSLVSITNNTLISYGAAVGLRIVINPTTLGGDSLLRIDGNSFTSPQGAARVDAIVMTNTIRFDGTSRLSLVGNSRDARDRTNTYKLFTAAASSLSFAPTARAYACGTRYNGAPMRGRLLFNQYAADAAVGAAPIEHCARTVSASPSASGSRTPSATATQTRTVTTSETTTASASASTSLSTSGTSTQTVTVSASGTESATKNSISATASALATLSLTTTKSPTAYPNSATATHTTSVTASATATVSTSSTHELSPSLSHSRTATLSTGTTAATYSNSETRTSPISTSRTVTLTKSVSGTGSASVSITATATHTMSASTSRVPSGTATAPASTSTTKRLSPSLSRANTPSLSAGPTAATPSISGTKSATATLTLSVSDYAASRSATAIGTATAVETASATATASLNHSRSSSTSHTESATTSIALSGASPTAPASTSPTQNLSPSLSRADSVSGTAQRTASAIAPPSASSNPTATASASASDGTPTHEEPPTRTAEAPLTPSASASASVAPTASHLPSMTRSRAAVPTRTFHVLPDPIPMNAADGDDAVRGVIESAAAALAVRVALLPRGALPPPCRRLELLLLGSSVPSPVLAIGGGSTAGRLLGARTYEDALATSGVVLLAAAAAGLVVTLALWAVRRATKGAFGTAATTARFPATALQVLVFLSPGAAVSSGLAVGSGISDGGLIRPTAVAGAAAVAMAPLCWALLVAAAVRSSAAVKNDSGTGLVLVVAAAGDGTRDSLHFAGADDDPLDGVVHRRPAVIGGCLGGRALLCGGVRPLAVAARFGPLVGDLGGCYPSRGLPAASLHSADGDAATVGPLGAALRSLLPALLPWALLVAAGAAGYCNACEYIPLVSAALVALYALFVAALRPFTGHSHNAFEALWSVVAAGLLLWLWAAIVAAEEDDEGRWAPIALGGGTVGWSDAFSSSERAAVTCLGGLLSCRYPFVLARALGVGLPRVVAVLAGEVELTSHNAVDAETDDDDSGEGYCAPIIPISTTASIVRPANRNGDAKNSSAGGSSRPRRIGVHGNAANNSSSLSFVVSSAADGNSADDVSFIESDVSADDYPPRNDAEEEEEEEGVVFDDDTDDGDLTASSGGELVSTSSNSPSSDLSSSSYPSSADSDESSGGSGGSSSDDDTSDRSGSEVDL